MYQQSCNLNHTQKKTCKINTKLQEVSEQAKTQTIVKFASKYVYFCLLYEEINPTRLLKKKNEEKTNQFKQYEICNMHSVRIALKFSCPTIFFLILVTLPWRKTTSRSLISRSKIRLATAIAALLQLFCNTQCFFSFFSCFVRSASLPRCWFRSQPKG